MRVHPKMPLLTHPHPDPPLEGEGSTLSLRERVRVRVRVGILMSLCELQAHERTSLSGSKIREFAITPSLITTG